MTYLSKVKVKVYFIAWLLEVFFLNFWGYTLKPVARHDIK